MRDRYSPIHRFGRSLAAALLICTLATQARADVFGRLKFTVKNAADEKPLANAKITLKDSAGVHPDVTLTTDASGSATSPQLEARAWTVTTTAEKPDTFETGKQQATVAA